MILIADAHVSEAKGNRGEFGEMLAALSETSHDVVFLGDILDLWIALPAYETSLHREFLGWCRREIPRRGVGFIEGNHEFFLARHHADCFTFASAGPHLDGAGRLYAHGDTVNRADVSYRVLRAVTRSRLVHWLEGHLSSGPAVARFLKSRFEARSRHRPQFFPTEEVRRFAAAWGRRGARKIWLGHFHDHCVLECGDGIVCEVVPAWCGSGMVVVTDGTGPGQACRWRDAVGR
ncbi:MAG: hypothetical protein JXR77_12975 [Lentisphaeria bacterium]|nr:hypothetical protein [Lentisphaeria bacterium]